jgi:hypothetical protein
VTRASIGALLEQITLADGRLLIIGLDAFFDNPLAIPVALRAQAVLLCVTLGESVTQTATETLDLVRDKTIGSVVLRPRRGK